MSLINSMSFAHFSIPYGSVLSPISQELRNMRLYESRSLFSLIPQEPLLLGETLRLALLGDDSIPIDVTPPSSPGTKTDEANAKVAVKPTLSSISTPTTPVTTKIASLAVAAALGGDVNINGSRYQRLPSDDSIGSGVGTTAGDTGDISGIDIERGRLGAVAGHPVATTTGQGRYSTPPRPTTTANTNPTPRSYNFIRGARRVAVEAGEADASILEKKRKRSSTSSGKSGSRKSRSREKRVWKLLGLMGIDELVKSRGGLDCPLR
jgi:hypothetical protein